MMKKDFSSCDCCQCEPDNCICTCKCKCHTMYTSDITECGCYTCGCNGEIQPTD